METETDPRWLNDQEQRAWRTHLDVNKLLMYQLEKDLQPFGLTINDYEILVNLSESEAQRMRMSDLAAVTLQSKSRLSHQITRMENAGLVRREHCESDRRGLSTPCSRTWVQRPCRKSRPTMWNRSGGTSSTSYHQESWKPCANPWHRWPTTSGPAGAAVDGHAGGRRSVNRAPSAGDSPTVSVPP
jgi:hypothetical protein